MALGQSGQSCFAGLRLLAAREKNRSGGISFFVLALLPLLMYMKISPALQNHSLSIRAWMTRLFYLSMQGITGDFP